ncbi:MAG TPA: FAD-dependent oxidoreductase [Thermoanaerobaculia bacterium]|nr:FAD-dependent oxidoreductase [Thermoanaerobaculia bacterium]
MSESNGGGWTRRRFLELVGRAGGTAAVYETMVALDLLKVPAAWAGPPQLPQDAGAGKRVLVLGAGIGGLTAADMLRKAGFSCLVLEAQGRAGGRNFTARRGTKVVEDIPDHGRKVQDCRFDPGLYLNLGPGRIPYHHRRVLRYCRELSVPLEVYVMETTANLFFREKAFGDQPMVNRRIANDTRGHVAELLAKAVHKGALDEELKGVDREKLVKLLRKFGDLGAGFKEGKCPSETDYCGSTRSGCAAPITVERPCTPAPKLGLQELVSSEFWEFNFYQPVDYLWQPTLFQPVHGMDQLVEGFKKRLKGLIRRNSEVTRITIRRDGVEVEYRDLLHRTVHVEKAHYCVSNIPLSVLKKIPVNFEPGFEEAVKKSKFAPSCKVGWQANERFWESDANQIFGGISWTNQDITQIWYPSNDYHSTKGTLTGAYNYRDSAEKFGRMLPEPRLEEARRQGARLHKEFDDPKLVPLDKGISIAWQNVPFQEGAWATWDETNKKYYGQLLIPDRTFYFVGDQVSQLPGWQEGAMMSAEHVVKQIAGQLPVTLEKLEEVVAPDTRALVEGS